VIIDRPEAKGGADKGPMGGELLLAGLGGCFMSNLLAAIAARDVEATDMKLEVTGVLEQNPPRFTSASISISGSYTDKEEIERLADMSEKACICSNTLRGSIDLKIIVT
jgi:putative redox protein